ncbi:MAG: hypothetical protein J6M30_05695 [Bacteroidales bacterium]|nr:hypothetical protein [Bacteroidales bacterium]
MSYKDYIAVTNKVNPTISQSNRSEEYLQNLFKKGDRNLVEKISDFVFPKTTYVKNPNTGNFDRQNRAFKQNIDNAIETIRPVTDWTVGVAPITATPYWTMMGARDIMKGNYFQGALEFAPSAYRIAEKIPSIIENIRGIKEPIVRRGMLSVGRFTTSPNPGSAFKSDLLTDRKNALNYLKDTIKYSLTGNPNHFPKIYRTEDDIIRGTNTGNIFDVDENVLNSKNNIDHYNYFRSLPDNILGANTMGKAWLNPQKFSVVEDGSELDMLLKETFGENYRNRFNGKYGETYVYAMDNVSDIIPESIESENILEKTAKGNNMIVSAGTHAPFDVTKGIYEPIQPRIMYDYNNMSVVNVAGNNKIIGTVKLKDLDEIAKEVYKKEGWSLPERDLGTYRTADAYKFEPEAYKKRWLTSDFKDKIAIPFLKKYHKYENPVITIEKNANKIPFDDDDVFKALEYHFNNKKYGGYLLWI